MASYKALTEFSSVEDPFIEKDDTGAQCDPRSAVA